jgi:Putative adhesin
VSLRKIALLILIVGFAATVETAWNLQGDVRFGPEGCRVMGGRFYGPSWSYETAGERAVTAASPRLEIENAFGGVKVSAGAPGLVKVRLRKVVYQPTEEKARAFAQRVELRLGGDDGLVRVGTNRDELGRSEEAGFETHLEIEAPAASVAELRSEHGRVELRGLATADVSSSFDSVSIDRVAGDVKLESRHGDVIVEGIGGALQLGSRHGRVSVAAVKGASKIDVQHGDVEARRTGPLEIGMAHGSLTLETVGGDLVVRSQHGDVSGTDIEGGADVESSFGALHLERVGGELRARVQHGGITASDVSGGADLEATHDGVTLERVAGPVQAVVQHGGVEARGLAQGARIRASGSSVSLDGFAGPVDVQVERGGARLAPGAAIAAEIAARVTHGDIQLEVPEGSRFDLEAESRRGRVDAPLSGLSAEDEGRQGQRASGRHAEGGVSVRLEADGDVRLESRPARSRNDWTVARPRSSEKQAAEAAPSPRPASPAPSATPTAAEAAPTKPDKE